MSNKVFGLIGLGVMGKSLARNLANKGHAVALYNRHVAGKEENVATDFVAAFPDELHQAAGLDDLRAFVAALERPRRIFIMVNAGAATDAVIDELVPLLAHGDLLMDGGNAHYKDTERRGKQLAAKGLLFLGTGVSGGEEGALKGPAIMPGGSAEAYALAKPYIESIAAKDKNGLPCCAHIGQGGAGHFVKMVHNGIEYAEMQLLAEVYYIFREVFGYTPDAIAATLDAWLTTDAASYLMEITRDILRVRAGEGWLLDLVEDAASSKGTGGWATAAAADLGVPATMISEALFARYLSSFAQERRAAAQVIHFKNAITADNRAQFAFDPALLWAAYQLARVVNHHQGLHLIQTASETYGWHLNLPEIARVWTNGCIIRSRLMEDLVQVLTTQPRMMQHPVYAKFVEQARPALIQTVVVGLSAGLETPCLSSALQFCNGYNNPDSPMNIIQAQRDYFGAHTYTRKDTGAVVTGGFTG
jgi:6-phosphogluconate dehydrogenase